ncbi:MAG: RNA-binding protein [Alphaproteobacteria bacterium]|nr:RNA-binding protein [Alphaproteobacteria bacterium]
MKNEEERKCIVDGEVKSKDELLRFTITPDNMVVPDFKKKLPGRGIFVSNSKKALQTAIEKGLFSKAVRKKVRADNQLIELVEKILRKKGLDFISLAKKAGVLVTGFEKVKEALVKNKAAFILEAKNAGEDGHEKMVSLAKDLEVFVLYDVEELDQALNKVNTVHVAFLKSEMAKTVHDEFKKLQVFLNS